MKYAAAVAVVLLIAGVALAPAASAQRARATPVGPSRPPVAAPPVLTPGQLTAPSMRVPQVTLPRQERFVLPAPPVVAPGVGDGGGDDYDSDGDGYSSSDCNDSNASVHPGAPEVYNGRDDNCDGASY